MSNLSRHRRSSFRAQSRDPDELPLRCRRGLLRLRFAPLRMTRLYLLLPPSLFQNKSIARLVFRPRFKSFRELSPRAHRMMPAAAALGLTLATASGCQLDVMNVGAERNG